MKKWIRSMLIVCLILTALCACQSSDRDTAGKEPGTTIAETDQSITIVDQAGREVTVTKNIKSIALCYRVVIRFLLSLDQGEKIKGIGKTEDFLKEVEPSLKKCVSVGQGVADIEALAELSPDVFFHKARDEKTLDAVERLGIPAVGINVETPEDMRQAIDIMGKICGAQDKAKQLINYYDTKLGALKEKTKSIKEKKTAILMGSSLGDVADGTMLQSEMIQRAGGVNLAEDVEATELWPTVGVEQIFQWNPDYIFITNSESAAYTAEDILKDPTWSELKAVKAKHVYVMPATADSWELPGIVSVLGMEYLMKTMYPKLMSDTELKKEVEEFYQLSYGKTFSREKLGY